MSQIQVFRVGTTWKYALKGVASPESFETRDDALFAAESATVAAMKEEEKKIKKVEPEKQEPAKVVFDDNLLDDK